jgi:L-lactate dehydrogenase
VVSHYQPEYGCCLSLPMVLVRQGVVRTMDVPMSPEELGYLARSAKVLKEECDSVLWVAENRDADMQF